MATQFAGMPETRGVARPASSSSTRRRGFSESRVAGTQPAEPAATMITLSRTPFALSSLGCSEPAIRRHQCCRHNDIPGKTTDLARRGPAQIDGLGSPISIRSK